jgi:hypothetical protein
VRNQQLENNVFRARVDGDAEKMTASAMAYRRQLGTTERMQADMGCIPSYPGVLQ